MTAQTVITIVLAALGLLFLLKDALGSALTGGCASGCGSCGSGGCPVKRLEALGDTGAPRDRRSA